jgi:hypothetical protein
MPAWQVSVCVQTLLSSHAVPSAFAGFEHWPVVGSHVPAVWHWSEAVHSVGLLPVQVPPCQVSVCVHALLSLHAVPSSLAGFEQVPLVGSQVPALWH